MLTFLRAVHFWILQNQELKLPVDSNSEAAFTYQAQKSIISRTNEAAARTSELDVQHGWKERFAQLYPSELGSVFEHGLKMWIYNGK